MSVTVDYLLFKVCVSMVSNMFVLIVVFALLSFDFLRIIIIIKEVNFQPYVKEYF